MCLDGMKIVSFVVINCGTFQFYTTAWAFQHSCMHANKVQHANKVHFLKQWAQKQYIKGTTKSARNYVMNLIKNKTTNLIK